MRRLLASTAAATALVLTLTPGAVAHDDHDHADPATKNALSRGGETGADTRDSTIPVQARTNEALVAAHRSSPEPTLVPRPLTGKRRAVPQNRHAMAGGCYALQAPNGRWLRRDGDRLVASAARRGGAERLRFRATDLGTYLLYDRNREFVGRVNTQVRLVGRPATSTEWSARASGAGYTFTLPGGGALNASGQSIGIGPATAFTVRRVTGCKAYPEVQVNVTGAPHGGSTSYQEVRGYVDAHVHGMAHEFLGGQVHCGRPWHPYGPAYALVDCPDHLLTAGYGGVLESVLSGRPSHDPIGWPTFKDWPAPHSLTHQGTYYKWVERSWRGGLRVMTNLLVENGQLCTIYPLKRNSCDEMTSIRLQAKRMREFERYVDAQYGGPGKGWYRIVRNPRQARRVINQGKLAVVMGIETSVPFGCSFTAIPLVGDQPACTRADIDRHLDEMHRLGVRQMELVNKFDNALAGVAGDAGEVGVAVNVANFLETGTFWDMRHCNPADGESADQTQATGPDIGGDQQDALFGAIASLGLTLPALPLYPRPKHCNSRGLTDLGRYAVDGMAKRQWLVDPDHMSVKARQATLDRLEQLKYPGVISSHSWATPDAYPRIYRLGGFITPYAGDSTGFVAKWRRHLGWADPRFFFGFGFGSDINGLGAQGDPRGAGATNPVTYPFTGINGITVHRQVSGEKIYDINVHGVAHHGLYPDWVEDLLKVAAPGERAALRTDMQRGAEAFLQTWERAQGARPDSCRNPGLRKTVRKLKRVVRPSMTTQRVIRRLGQPYARVDQRFILCAKRRVGTKADGSPRFENVRVRLEFNRAGRLQRIRHP
ncbi:hypothetical protein [Nocardioides limicola]|uniref:hypothetical protein n=1 Tax=Nocardioides limicola TaxID=2803368 RepID=UPI00193C7D0C|nr:hypothetical protein [Nocardioides sp. DJM-14]